MTAPRLFTAVLLLLLSACVTQSPHSTDTISWTQQQSNIAAITHWSVQGKVAIRTANGLDSARLHWQQRGNDMRLELSGPVGLGQVVLEQTDGRSRLLREGEWQDIEHFSTALESELGWPLPLELMPWWLRGLPAPSPAPTRADVLDDRLHALQQADWQLKFSRYMPVTDTSLPARIAFSRGDVSGKLLLKRWELLP